MEETETGIAIFNKIKTRFVQLVDESTFKTECSFALQVFEKNSYLNKATTSSKLQAVMNVAQTGLTLNPVRQHAYLVPRASNGKIECTLMPSFRGIVHLIMKTGMVKKIDAQVVKEGDEFSYQLGLSPDIKHVPLTSNEQAKITHAYAFAILTNGEVVIEVVSLNDLEEIKSQSESYKSHKSKGFASPWVTWEGEMSKKAAIKRLCKHLPEGKDWVNVQEAIAIDNTDYKAQYWQIEKIEGLLRTSTYGHEDREMIENTLSSLSSSEAYDWINRLQQNQIDKVSEGMASQKEITEHIKTITHE
jgi:phage RecT family recombinase